MFDIAPLVKLPDCKLLACRKSAVGGGAGAGINSCVVVAGYLIERCALKIISGSEYEDRPAAANGSLANERGKELEM